MIILNETIDLLKWQLTDVLSELDSQPTPGYFIVCSKDDLYTIAYAGYDRIKREEKYKVEIDAHLGHELKADVAEHLCANFQTANGHGQIEWQLMSAAEFYTKKAAKLRKMIDGLMAIKKQNNG